MKPCVEGVEDTGLTRVSLIPFCWHGVCQTANTMIEAWTMLAARRRAGRNWREICGLAGT